MKRIMLIALLSIAYLSINAQQMIPDSVATTKIWIDKNGRNELKVDLFTAFNDYSDITCHDGHPSIITATLKNEKHNLKIQYSLEDYMLKMLKFYDEGIWFHNIDGVQAVFIPFFYNAMLDSEMLLSYIILYDNKKFLYHFNYLWEEGSENVKLVEPKLDKRLHRIPLEVRTIFKDYLIKNYKTTEDIVPNTYRVFMNPKFQTKTKIDVSTTYYANYPYILLDKIDYAIRQGFYKEASDHLLRFKKLYVDFTITNDYSNYPEIQVEDQKVMLDKATALRNEDRFVDAYMIYMKIMEQVNSI